MVRKPSYEELEQTVKELQEKTNKNKRAEKELQEKQKELDIIFNSVPALIWSKNSKGKYLQINKKYCETVGLSRENIVGRTDYDLYPTDIADQYSKYDQEIVNSKKPISGIEERHLKLSGDYGWSLSEKLPYYDAEGNVVGTIGFALDITEHKQAEEALRKSEKRFRELADLLPEPVFETNTEEELIFANQIGFDLFGYTKNDFDKGLDCLQMLIPEDRDRARKNIQRVLSGEKFGGIEYTAQRKDGTTFHTIVYASQIIHENKPVGTRGIMINITGLKLAEEEKEKLQAQLQQARKMEAIGTLAGGIAHDFNNILMGIQGYASLMLLGIDSSHPHYNRLKGIKKQVQSGAKLTRQLLGYARKGRYEVKPISLNKLVEETSDTFGRTRKEITIHQELAKDLFVVEADQGQIEQVLLNLYVNAADAMSIRADGAAGRPGGGNLILKTMNTTHDNIKGTAYNPEPGNYVLVTVTDTGIGLNKKTIERIFDPFFTTKEMGRGTGLGLASAYGIIKGHGGYIDVESKKGKGTTFSIYLPASEKKVRKAVKTAEQFIKGTGTVLLVDDEEVILEVGEALLETMGYRVLIAMDGKEAVEVYRKNKDDIDIVLLDMVMPNMGGSEAYDRMKEINSKVKVLLSSGYSINSQATEILERGCDGFIQKPFSVKKLSIKIREILCKK